MSEDNETIIIYIVRSTVDANRREFQEKTEGTTRGYQLIITRNTRYGYIKLINTLYVYKYLHNVKSKTVVVYRNVDTHPEHH